MGILVIKYHTTKGYVLRIDKEEGSRDGFYDLIKLEKEHGLCVEGFVSTYVNQPVDTDFYGYYVRHTAKSVDDYFFVKCDKDSGEISLYDSKSEKIFSSPILSNVIGFIEGILTKWSDKYNPDDTEMWVARETWDKSEYCHPI